MTNDLSDHPAHVARISGIVDETLDGLLRSGVVDVPLPDVAGHDGIVIESAIAIVGDGVSSRLVLRVPAATAVALAAALTDESTDDVDLDAACAAMSELCNMIAGSAKTLIDTETALDIPTSTPRRIRDLDDLDTIRTDHRLATFDVHLSSRRSSS